jgi:hypothetical protein
MASLVKAGAGAFQKQASAKFQGAIKGATGKAQAALTGRAKDLAGAAAETAQQKAAAVALSQATGLSSTEAGAAAAAASKLAGGTGAALSGVTNFFKGIGSAFTSTGNYIWGGLTRSPTASTTQVLVIWFIILGLVLWLFFYFAAKRGWFAKKPDPSATAAALNAQVATAEIVGANVPTAATNLPSVGTLKEGFAASTDSANINPTTLPLLSLQPLTVKQAGFLGPLPNGEFDPANATGQALRAGFRSFTLQIDFLDKRRDPAKYADVGMPTLLYRGDDGSLISTNSGSIGEVVKTIAALAFRPEVPNYTQPIILYLHILRAPSQVKEQDKYLTFLSKIAQQLNPLAPNHLGMSPLGVFHRQKNEETLINTPISSFEGNVIILSNADTTGFRSSTLTTPFPPANDLDYWVNMRVYLNSEFDVFGIAQTPPAGVTPNAIIVGFGALLAMSPQRSEAFTAKAKTQFVIAMPSALSNPTYKDLGAGLALGVNMVPLDVFSDSLTNVKNLVRVYSNKSYSPKAAAAAATS